MTGSSTFVDAAEAPWREVEPGVERQVLAHAPALMLVRVRFAAGAVGAVHRHPHRQASYVAAGAFEVEVGGARRVLRAGDSFIVEPDVLHGVVALEAGELVDAFTPMRETFVEPPLRPPHEPREEHHMAELIHTHTARVRRADGTVFEARTLGEARDDGTWIGWLEFRPVDAAAGGVLRTDRETTQPDRAALDYWAGGLEPVFLEGALVRARAVA